MGEERKVYKVFVENPEEKGTRGRPRRRWEDDSLSENILGRLAGEGLWSGFSWLGLWIGGGIL
jgi:hypothetical protein